MTDPKRLVIQFGRSHGKSAQTRALLDAYRKANPWATTALISPKGIEVFPPKDPKETK